MKKIINFKDYMLTYEQGNGRFILNEDISSSDVACPIYTLPKSLYDKDISRAEERGEALARQKYEKIIQELQETIEQITNELDSYKS